MEKMRLISGLKDELCETGSEISVEWKIKEFLTLSQDPGVYYRSPVFSFGDSHWSLEIYPGGNNMQDNTSWISVYIRRHESETPRYITYSLAIRNVDECDEDVVKNKDHCFDKICPVKGKKKFYLRSELLKQKSDLLPSDDLTIACNMLESTKKRIEVLAKPIKLTVKNKPKHQQLQQAQILKKLFATMQNHRMSAAVLQTSPGNSNSSNQPSPGAQPHSSPDPPQPGIGAQNPQPYQNPQTPPNPQLDLRQPTQLTGGPNDMSNSIGNSAMGPPQVMPNPGPPLGGMQRPTEAWQQLLQALRSPLPSDQKQQQVLDILKSNPPLMAAFIKQRSVQQQQQLMLLNEGIDNLNISK